MNKGLDKENQLVEQAKRDPQQFGLIYDRYVEQIYRYVFRRVSDQAVAEDLTSQTFYDALAHLNSYEFKGYPFSAWLYKIAHNNVLKWYRVTTRAPKVDLEDIVELKSDENISDEAAVNQERVRIMDLLQKLEYEERELIRLKYFEEVTNIEIGQIMGISANNVGVKLYRSLKKLKQLMSA
jgi:RNA polymerase sigma-70 factor (ECF subfamily)